MSYTFNYKCDYDQVASPEITMTFGDGITVDTFLEFVQNFMVASGYVLDDGDYITIGNRIEEDKAHKEVTTCEKHWENFWEDDGFSMTGNPAAESPDTIQFVSPGVLGGMGEDHISFSSCAGAKGSY